LERRAKGAAPAGEFSDDLRRILRTELLKGSCSLGAVARFYAMHRRTLTRRLGAEGTAFRQIADEVRFEIACQLLAEESLSLGQIAAALKFSEPSAFTRAFRRWSGVTPTGWRTSDPHDRPMPPRAKSAPRPLAEPVA
jgi:AraC-like DNA-binding protein